MTSSSRLRVSSTVPARTRLTVSARGRPGTAPSKPCPRAPIRRSRISSVTSGRAASCTRITAASSGTSATPARTESARVSPPATQALTFDAPTSSASRDRRLLHSGGATTTIESIHGLSSRRRSGSASRADRRGERTPSAGLPELLPLPGGDKNGPTAHLLAAVRFVAAAGFVAGVDFALVAVVFAAADLAFAAGFAAATFLAGATFLATGAAAFLAAGAATFLAAGVFRAAAFSAGVSFGFAPSVSVSSSHSSASSSLMFWRTSAQTRGSSSP